MLSSNVTSVDPWDIIAYEVRMLFGLSRLLAASEDAPFGEIINNAMVESACLHARVLVDILVPRQSVRADDIRLDEILPGFQHRSLDNLRAAYGDAKIPGSPCWRLNKMIMHPTTMRATSHDYTNLLNKLLPLIETVLQEVDASRRTGGRESLSCSPSASYVGLCAKTSS